MRRPIRVLELRSVWGTGGGPEKTILSAAASADPRQFATTVCYLRDVRDPVFALDRRATALGVDYVEVSERHSLDPAVWPALRRLVQSRSIDIVHSHDYKTDLLAWILSKAEPVICLSTAHGWTGHSRREKRVYYPFDKRLLARFDHVIAVSREIQSELLRAGASRERTTVVLNGIDPGMFRRDRWREPNEHARYGFSTGDVVIGAVGRLESQKRFDLLIDALAILLSRRSDLRLHLVIAGAGRQRDALDQQAHRLGVRAHCHLLGHVSDIVGLHHAFDLFVQASDYEGTPNAVLEAMALETPVIATRAGGTSDLIEDGVHGVLVEPGDPAIVASAIERVLADRKVGAARAAAARRRVEIELSFQARMTAVEAVYEDLFRRRTTAAAAAECLV